MKCLVLTQSVFPEAFKVLRNYEKNIVKVTLCYNHTLKKLFKKMMKYERDNALFKAKYRKMKSFPKYF